MNALMDFFKKLGAVKVGALLSVALVILSPIVWLVFSAYKVPMSPLYSNLSLEDSSIIASKLQAMGIQYTVSADNAEITVPMDRVHSLRIGFAEECYPSSGNIVGYEIFDKSDAFGTSQFVYNVNLVRALEGELSRTISGIASIESARVHLVLPKKELFSKDSVIPSASVVLKVAKNKQIGKNEVAAITHLVSAAVSELKAENITIIDSNGKPLKLNSDDGEEFGVFATGMLDFKGSVESRLTRSIEEILERSVGVGKVKASVTADIDFDREVINTETYDPDGQVIRSHKVSEEKESDTKKSDNVSVATNLPYPGAQKQPTANFKSRSKSDEITNYEISKKVSNRISESGKIKSLSIAVLVDGTYTVDRSSGNPISKYNTRTDEELQQIKDLVISAVGIDEKRGDKLSIVNMQFITGVEEDVAPETLMDWLKHNMRGLIQTAIITIVSILLIVLVVKPFIAKIIDDRSGLGIEGARDLESMITGLEMSPQAAAAAISELGSSGIGSASADNINSNSSEGMDTNEQGIAKRSASLETDTSIEALLSSAYSDKNQNLLRHLNDAVNQHIDGTVSIIRNWLYKGED